MAIIPSARVVCDGGCGAHLYGQDSTVARAAAALEGWSFPPQRKSNGRPAKRAHDVCPKCSPSFEVKTIKTNGMYDGLPPEERRLKAFLNMNWNLISREERARLETQLAEMQAAREGSSS